MTKTRSTSQDENSSHDNIELGSLPIFNQSKEALETQIYPNFSLNQLGLFAQTSIGGEDTTAFLRLLSCAVDAEPESYQQEDETRLAAIVILKRHPELLFRKGTVIDHFGRKIVASPYQLFLGTGDTWAIKQVHENIIPNIQDGAAQAQLQFKQQFPHCPWPPTPDLDEEVFYDDRNKKQIQGMMAQIKAIGESVEDFQSTASLDAIKKAFTALYLTILPKDGEVIRAGLHFPQSIMLTLHDIYLELNELIPLRGALNELLGTAEAALTAVDGQCFKNGIINLDMEKGPDRRDGLCCRHPKGIPQDLSPITDKRRLTMFIHPFNGWSILFAELDDQNGNWYDKNGIVNKDRINAIDPNNRDGDWNKLLAKKLEIYANCFSNMLQCGNSP